ncbi:helix-turn-helix domain-containing protein [Halocatena salina]|uniref:Helix-turn-helix domain-containing protein n=1 Tax=Halocatena salina TaxID=2934340 RepID=A0A8T9ZYF6_9EURY|nr:helix-turn-helix domain-containing protein [Halocatena salina]UPM41691.1 helix-turn-helix domain-containing protein [Halocatena salina]
MPHIQIQLDGTAVDGWLATISTDFPDAEFRLLATQLRDDGAFVILEVVTPKGDALAHRFENTPEVDSVEVHYTDEQLVLLQFRTSATKSYDPLRESNNVSLYPTILRDGWFSVELAASHERLSEYTDELVAADIPYQVLSLTQAYDSSELLTNRQWHIITEAVERGYYDTPRDCTVTELAESLDIHKSAASRLLHRAESRIVTGFVTGTAR